MSLSKNELKKIRSLAHKKDREEQGRFVVEGVRLVSEAITSDFEILEVYHTSGFLEEPANESLLRKLTERVKRVEQVSSREIETISDTVTSQGIAAVIKQRAVTVDRILKADGAQSILVAFDGVADPGNVGTMVRTCDWFGVNGILLGKNSVELYNPKLLRATMGGIFHIAIADEVDLLSTVSHARDLGYRIYVTDQGGETHFDRVQYSSKSLLIFGNEAWGVSDQLKQLADARICIRRYGAGESLNVGVACGVVLSSLHRLYDE
jgi:RNA methyltransferase, TrmH family